MTELENELYWEMVRTIHLLGGKSDILGILNMMNSSMSQAEAVEETYKMVKCWNDNVEKLHLAIPENALYLSADELGCK